MSTPLSMQITTFPWFQSCLPGGINYDLTAPLEQRVLKAARAAEVLLLAAKAAGTNRYGRIGCNEYTPQGLLQRYTEHGTLRTDRKAWKDLCQRLKVWSAVPEWAVPVTADDTKNWVEFRLGIHVYLKQFETRKPQPELFMHPALSDEDTKPTPDQLFPTYESWMQTGFPFLMSHVPGGINYDMSISRDLRVDAWIRQVRISLESTAALGVSLGGNKFPNVGHSFYTMAGKLGTSTELRKVRAAWKKHMDKLEWDRSDELWRRADGRDQKWANEWLQFRDNFKLRYSHMVELAV